MLQNGNVPPKSEQRGVALMGSFCGTELLQHFVSVIICRKLTHSLISEIASERFSLA